MNDMYGNYMHMSTDGLRGASRNMEDRDKGWMLWHRENRGMGFIGYQSHASVDEAADWLTNDTHPIESVQLDAPEVHYSPDRRWVAEESHAKEGKWKILEWSHEDKDYVMIRNDASESIASSWVKGAEWPKENILAKRTPFPADHVHVLNPKEIIAELLGTKTS